MNSEIHSLKERIVFLEHENAELKKRVAYFEIHPSMAAGIKGETLVSKLIGGTLTTHNAPYDVSSQSGLLIEVKFSSLTVTDRKKKVSTMRWTWKNIFGSGGNKKYDRILLIGPADPRFTDSYLDEESPYIIFDIPYEDIAELTTSTEFGRRIIQLTSNPKTQQTARNKKIFQAYQTTITEVEKNYGI